MPCTSTTHDHPTIRTGAAWAGDITGGKTHAGFRSALHGLSFLVDHRGTRRIDRVQAEAIHDAPPGVDLYFA